MRIQAPGTWRSAARAMWFCSSSFMTVGTTGSSNGATETPTVPAASAALGEGRHLSLQDVETARRLGIANLQDHLGRAGNDAG